MPTFSLNTNSVAAVAQGLVSLVMGLMLRSGARTPARKTLARVQLALAAYAAAMFFSLSLQGDAASDTLSLISLLAGIAAAIGLVGFAMWLDRGAHAEEEAAAPPLVRAPVVALAVIAATASAVGVWTARGTLSRMGSIGLNVILLVLFGTLFVRLRSAVRRDVAGARTMARACVWPVVAIVANIVWNALAVSGHPLPTEPYYVARDVSLLLFTFGLLVTYLDHGHEPMSLHSRLIAGTLTIVAILVTSAAHVLGPWVSSLVAADGRDAAEDGLALRLVALLAAGVALLYGLLPRLFRRNVLAPLDALVAATAAVEKGEKVELPVEREDELGRLSRSFNAMSRGLADGRRALEDKVEQLESRRKEVEQLNDELRHQIASRSKSIAETLAHDVSSPPSAAGMLVGGRYRLDRVLGQGGMGVVYEVSRTTDDRRFALKMLSGQGTPADAMRLAREAEIAASVSHPNLVGVVDVGVHDGRVFLVMDLVAGGSLEDARARFGELGFAMRVLAQVASGLAKLHERGIVHRDLKPSNVLLDEAGGTSTAKIADFGIARLDAVDAFAATAGVDASTERAMALTKTGMVLGTLAYMAPELAQGSRAVTPPVDVFAFGIVAYEVLTGRYPFKMPPMLAIISSLVLPETEELPASTPPAVRAAIASALAFEPRDRPTANELAELLAQPGLTQPIAVVPSS